MKALSVPVLLGVGVMAILSPGTAEAQMPFTASQLPNSNPYARSGSLAPQGNSGLPPVATATAVPANGAAYNPALAGYPVAAYSNETIDPDHKLSRGDRLSYRVIEDRDPQVIPLIVTDSGEVDVPLINRVKAAGKTTGQLTSDIKSRLEQEYYYHATVVLGLDAVAPRASRGTVYFSGALRSPGALELPLDSPLTVGQAVQKLGGATDFGDLKHVRVIRKGGPLKGNIINVRAVLDKGELDKDMTLQPGDQVVVPEKTFNVNF